MPFDAPISLGPFTVDQTGRLTPLPDGGLPGFRLRWRGRDVAITFTCAVPSIRLSLVLGRVPSTAALREGAAPAREGAFSTLRWLPRCLPEGWRAELLADHRVVLRTHTDMEMPARATDVLAALVTFLLAAGPYLDLLDEGGLGCAADPA